MQIGISHPDNPYVEKHELSLNDFFDFLKPKKQEQDEWAKLIHPFFKKMFDNGAELYRHELWKCTLMGAGLSAISAHINLLEFCLRKKLDEWKPSKGIKSLIDKAANKNIFTQEEAKEIKKWYDEIGNDLRHANAISLGKIVKGRVKSIDPDSNHEEFIDIEKFKENPTFILGVLCMDGLRHVSYYIAHILIDYKLVKIND